MLYCDIIIKEEGISMNKFFALILVVATVAVSGCGATLAIEGPAVGGRSSFFGNSTVVITNNTTATSSDEVKEGLLSVVIVDIVRHVRSSGPSRIFDDRAESNTGTQTEGRERLVRLALFHIQNVRILS